MSSLFAIPPHLLPAIIGIVYPMIESAAEYSVGKYEGKDILKLIIDGKFQLWGAVEGEKINGIAITEIVDYPRVKMCRFLCATGENLSEWMPLIKDIEAWAVSKGCKSFQAECRPGWERLLKPYGYEKSHIIMNKELDHVSQ
jgi:hypothetical protein